MSPLGASYKYFPELYLKPIDPESLNGAWEAESQQTIQVNFVDANN